MYKGLFLLGLSFVCTTSFAQKKIDFYKVHELQITDLNQGPSSSDLDFGYNTNSKAVGLGYYLWIEDAWYKIVNANEIFESEKKSPLYFKIEQEKVHDLKIKDPLDVVYSYSIAAIENYKISDIIYQTNLDVFENISEAKSHQIDNMILDSSISNTKDLVIQIQDVLESTHESQSQNTIKTNINEVVDLVENTNFKTEDELVAEDQGALDNINESLSENNPIEALDSNQEITLVENNTVAILDKDEVSLDSTNTQVDTGIKTTFEETTDGTIIIPEDIENKAQAAAEIITLEIINVKPEINIEKNEPKNAYEKAVDSGFDGTVTEWVESINALGGKTAFEQALDTGFNGTEEEWMRSLWGSAVDPEIEKQNKIAGIVAQWISELNSSAGSSPYDLALKNGFYGSYTEWIESVVGKDGEIEYEKEVKLGFEGTYKQWIESKLKVSNDELLRKEKLRKNNFIVVPNLLFPLSDNLETVLEFDLYDYYNTYFGNSVLSSSGSKANKVELLRSDLEYQITWYNHSQIEIIKISPQGIVSYKTLNSNNTDSTSVNVRFLIP